MSLAQKLITLRKQKGLTQMELAEQLNVSRQAISRWEVGAAVPGIDNLRVLGDLYEVPIDYLLNDETEKTINYSPITTAEAETSEYKTLNKKGKFFVICILVLFLIVSISIGIVKMVYRGQEQIVPMRDMEIGEEDKYLTETFLVE